MNMTRREFVAAAAAGSTLAQQPESGPKVRIGIVGGRFGATFQWHLHPRCEVAAVCDIEEAALARLAQTYWCGNRYKDFREMLKHPGLDAVGVFTPAPLHAWMTLEALKAGKHVISAVPAGLSEDELAEILEAVKKTGLRYMMAETSYYRPETITCMEWARQGNFGTILYSESEYHHPGLSALMFDERGLPTWRHGFPPMLYPTHCTGFVVPVTGERLASVSAIGWGDGHEILRTNLYRNPFWNTNAFFRTSGGHAARIAVCWHIAAGGVERAAFYGDRASFIMARPEGSPNTVFRIERDGQTVVDANGYREQDVKREAWQQPLHFERLPQPMRVRTGHGNSHTFLTYEFVQAILEERHPSVNIWEAIAYTLPGIIAHQSALKGGELLKIPDYGRAA
jgi:predicted dehydrogenase